MALNAYMQIKDVPGESTDEGHKDWINLIGFSHNLDRPTAEGRAGSARQRSGVNIGDFVAVKDLDKATPLLNMFCCDGKNIPEVVVELCDQSGDHQTFMKYTLTNCKVSSFSISGGDAGDRPSEEVTFNFEKIAWEYTPIGTDNKAAAAVARTWDLEKGRPA